MDINSLMPNDSVAKSKAATAGLVRKWERTGLLEGLGKEYEKSGMAVLLENQAKQLVSEANSTGTSANSEEWSGVALPLVRRIFAEIAAKDFVSVQPMNLPSGLVFFLDFKYGTNQPGFTTNSGKDSQNDSVFGVTDDTLGSTVATEGLYGAGRFGYSVNETSLGNKVTATGVVGTNIVTGSAFTQTTFEQRTNHDSEFSASLAAASVGIGQLTTVDFTFAASDLADANGVRAFQISGSGIETYYPQFTTVSGNTGLASATPKVSFLVKSSVATAAVENGTITYQKQPGDTSRGDFEDQSQDSGASNSALAIPEINLEMRSEAIVAKTRKLKAIWTPEFAQDLNAYHSIDAEAELTSMLSEYVSQEIDLELLDMLMQNAQTTDFWSARLGFEYDSTLTTFSNTAGNSAAYNQGTWFQTLGTKIQKVSNKIHQLTLRGGANFLVCSPTVATILESIPGYAADTDGDKMQFAMGVQKVGSINSRFQVYKNPYMTENTILMGYRGAQFLETGAVYAPYIPLIMTPLVYDPASFTPRKGVMTRYAKKMVRPEFYGKIHVDGLDTI